MPDITIPHLTLPTGASSSSSTPHTSARPIQGLNNTADTANRRNARKARRPLVRRNAKNKSLAENDGCESDSTVSSKDNQILAKKPRKILGRGNKKAVMTEAVNAIREKSWNNSAIKPNNNFLVPPVKKVRKSLGGGSTARKPQSLNQLLHNKSENPKGAAIECETSINQKIAKDLTETNELRVIDSCESKETQEPTEELETSPAESSFIVDTALAQIVSDLALKPITAEETISTEALPEVFESPNLAEGELESLRRSAKAAFKKIIRSTPNTPTKAFKNRNFRTGADTPSQDSRQIIPKSTPNTPSKSCNSRAALSPLPRQLNCGRISSQYYRETILNFRTNRSVSQMDLKQAKRSCNYQLIKASVCSNIENEYPNKVPITNAVIRASPEKSVASIKDPVTSSYEHKLYYVIHEQNPRFAGMRVLSMMMLNAWRKRRIEVQQLTEKVDELKHSSVKAKNQLHCFNSLFRIEKKRNEDLTLQIHRSQTELQKQKSYCDGLTTTISQLTTDLDQVTEQLEVKEKEYDDLNNVLNEVKSELFKGMSTQREMQTQLSNEQRRVQELENENAELLQELEREKQKAEMHEDDLNLTIEDQETELARVKAELQYYEEEAEKYKRQEQQLRESAESELKLKERITSLESDLQTLRKYVDATLANRCKQFWSSTKDVPRGTILWLHWLAFYMLPATPAPAQSPPTVPFGLNLDKALSIIKR